MGTLLFEILKENSLLLFFLVAALGFVIGRIRFGNFSLGVAAVLFVGLAVGSLSPELNLPDFVYQFGLALFVYTIGLASGPGFFATLSTRGLRYNALVAGSLVLVAIVSYALAKAFGLSPALGSGLFSGALTNAPALAGLLEETLRNGSKEAQSQLVTAFAVAYPVGVIAMMIALHFAFQRWGEASGKGGKKLHSWTFKVSNPEVVGKNLEDLIRQNGWRVVFGRLERGSVQSIITSATVLELGDRVNLVGKTVDLQLVAEVLGESDPNRLEQSRDELDFRRIFVSSHAVAGKTVSELDLPDSKGVRLTRIRRGDVDLLAEPDTVLELGDRIRIVGSRENIRSASSFFGDSYKSLAEIDVASFGLGIALGLLLGMIPVPLPGGGTFKLGSAGGPLIIGLILGKFGRTGPLLWQIPYSANLTLRQLGAIIFFVGIGVRSGYAFGQTIISGTGLQLLLVGAIITIFAAFCVIWAGVVLFKIPVETVGGILGGFQTQPAVLAFAQERSDSDQPNIGYATVYPIATLLKIMLGQMLLHLLK